MDVGQRKVKRGAGLRQGWARCGLDLQGYLGQVRVRFGLCFLVVARIYYFFKG